MIHPDEHDDFLDFVRERAREDEQRGSARRPVDEDLVDVAQMAQTMVRRMREGSPRVPHPAWIGLLQRFAEQHADHPDYHPGWRRTRGR